MPLHAGGNGIWVVRMTAVAMVFPVSLCKNLQKTFAQQTRIFAFAGQQPLTGANGLVVPQHAQILQLDDNWAVCSRERSERLPSVGMELAAVLPWKNTISPGVTKTASPGCKFKA